MHKCLVGFLALIKIHTLVYNKLKLECSEFVKLSFSIKLAFSKWINLFLFNCFLIRVIVLLKCDL